MENFGYKWLQMREWISSSLVDRKTRVSEGSDHLKKLFCVANMPQIHPQS